MQYRAIDGHGAANERLGEKRVKENKYDRGQFIGTAVMTIAAAQLGKTSNAAAASTQIRNSPSNSSFGPLKQIEAGLLNVGYVEIGPTNGRPVILLHGWPYDIHSFVDVAPLLSAKGYRAIVPHLRGHGSTRFLSNETLRNGQQSALASDIIALMDALKFEKAVIGRLKVMPMVRHTRTHRYVYGREVSL